MSAALDTDPSRAPLPTRHDDVVVFRTSRRRIFFVFFDGDTDFDSVHDFRTDLIRHRRKKKKKQKELVLPRRLGCITPFGVVAGRNSAKFGRDDFILCVCVWRGAQKVCSLVRFALYCQFFFFFLLVTKVLFYCARSDWFPLQLQRIDSFCR